MFRGKSKTEQSERCSSRGERDGLAKSVVSGGARGGDVHPAETGRGVQEPRAAGHLLRLLSPATVYAADETAVWDSDHIT